MKTNQKRVAKMVTLEGQMIANLTLVAWKELVTARWQSFHEFRDGSYREVCVGDVCPSGLLVREFEGRRDDPATFALLGPYDDPKVGDTFYGVPAYWLDESTWTLGPDPHRCAGGHCSEPIRIFVLRHIMTTRSDYAEKIQAARQGGNDP